MPDPNKPSFGIVNQILVVLLLVFSLVVLGFSFYRQINPESIPEKPSIMVEEPAEIAIFLMGESSYLYAKDINGNQYITNYLNAYLDSRLSCNYTLNTPTINQFNDSLFRIWGDPFERNSQGVPIATIDRDINTVSQFIAAKEFVQNAHASGKITLVVIGHGANESKDIADSAVTGKTHAKFHDYLNQAKTGLENLGARVVFATPVKGCPFAQRKYEPEGTLKDLANNVKSWYTSVADVFGAFSNHSCSDTTACPGPDECLTRCLINVNPYNSDGFPDRSCEEDYTHPNADGYTLMARAIGDAIINQNLCQAAPSPTPTTGSQPSPTPTTGSSSDRQKLLKGDLNLDGVVNSIDWSIMKAHFFNGTQLSEGDLNEDGTINSLDWSIMKAHFWENT